MNTAVTPGARLDTLAGLLDTIAARHIRLIVAEDRRAFSVQAPAGSLDFALQTAIRTHRAAILAALTATPAPAREGLHACAWGKAHHTYWRYHAGERRYVCRLCYPEQFTQEASQATQGSQEGATVAALDAGNDTGNTDTLDMSAAAADRQRKAAWLAWLAMARPQLAAWAQAHDWPRLAIGHSTNTHAGNPQPFLHIPEGEAAWHTFLAGAKEEHVAAAYRVAGLAPTPQTPEATPAPTEATPAATPAPAAPPRPGGTSERPALAVLDTAGLWIAQTGAPDVVCITDGIPAPAPAIHAGHLLDMARRHNITQLWVHASWALAAGLPDRLRGVKLSEGMAHPFADEAKAAGWDMRPAALAPWVHAFRPGTWGAVDLVLPHLETRAAWRDAHDGRELLAAILAYAESLGGYQYRRSPGATGTGLLQYVHSGNRIALDLTASAMPQDFPAPARAGHAAPDLISARPLTVEERARCAFVAAYDKNAMYLGACAALPLGLGLPEHCTGEGLTFDKRLAGYWLARITYTPPVGMPDPFTAPMHRTDDSGAGWYLSPMIELAYQIGATVTLQEAYIWRSSHRIMAPWYERMRDGRGLLLDRAASDPASGVALGVVKRTYTQAIGWLDGGWLRTSETPEDLYRPDWRHGVQAQAAANLYRELLKVQKETGRTPFAWDVDCAYFAAESADAAASCPAPLKLGTGLRHVKVKVNGAPLAPVAAILDRLSGTGASAGRMIDEITAALKTPARPVEGASEEAPEEAPEEAQEA